MPLNENYIAEVTVSVRLKSTQAGPVAEYSVTRTAKGASADPGETPAAANVPAIIGQALIDATAAHKAMMAGVHNAEARRLK